MRFIIALSSQKTIQPPSNLQPPLQRTVLAVAPARPTCRRARPDAQRHRTPSSLLPSTQHKVSRLHSRQHVYYKMGDI
jgi:hypothetical protein